MKGNGSRVSGLGSRRPLCVIVRPREEGAAMADAIRRAGFAVKLAPVMKYRFLGRAGALDPREFPALTLFASPRGVAAWLRRLAPAARRRLRAARPAAAVAGPATARAARAAGFRVVAGADASGARELAARLRARSLAPGAWLAVTPAAEGRLAQELRRAFPRCALTVRALYASLADPAGARRLRALPSPPALLVCGSPRQWALARRALGGRVRGMRVIVPGTTTAKVVRASRARAIVARNFTPAALRAALNQARRSLPTR